MKTKAERLADLRRRLEVLEAEAKAEEDGKQAWREYALYKRAKAAGMPARGRKLLRDSILRKMSAAGGKPQPRAAKVERAREFGRRGGEMEHAATVR